MTPARGQVERIEQSAPLAADREHPQPPRLRYRVRVRVAEDRLANPHLRLSAADFGRRHRQSASRDVPAAAVVAGVGPLLPAISYANAFPDLPVKVTCGPSIPP